ncbi:MAG: carboxymuconolactone decarboxylase family protein [Acidimicrobiia bacterium]
MQTEPPTRPSPLWRNGRLDQEFAELWNRGGLTRVERRWIAIAAHTAIGVPSTVRPYVYGALRSGDLTVDQLLEATHHAAYYCGFPRAQQLDGAVWEVAEELGLSPSDALDTEPRSWESPAAREDVAAEQFTAVVGVPAPRGVADLSVAGTFDAVFSEVWPRGVLTKKERRIVTVSCVVASASMTAAEAHTQGALRTGDLTYDELSELIHHCAFVTGWPRAAQMGTTAMRAAAIVAEENAAP